MTPIGALRSRQGQNSTIAWNNLSPSGLTTSSCEVRSKSSSCCQKAVSPLKVPLLRPCPRPRSASRIPPGSASGSQLSRLGGALACAASRSDASEVPLRKGSRTLSSTVLEKHPSSQQEEMGFPTGRTHHASLELGIGRSPKEELLQAMFSSQPPNSSSNVQENPPFGLMSVIPSSSPEATVAEQLEQMGVAPLAAAATLARLSPGSSLTDALNSLCREPNLPLDDPADSWECQICFQLQETHGWKCPDGHRYCSTCMRHHAKAVAFPRCPQPKCGFELDATDFRLLKLSRKRIEAFEQNRLETAIQTLGSGSRGDNTSEKVMHCKRDGCSNVVLVPLAGACRERFACPCGAPSFCTRCGDAPYHFHADCSQVPVLRRRWMDWVCHSHERRKKHAEALDALEKKLARDVEFRDDEMWKASHCRLCPTCNRVVEKIEGCNSMKCGQDCHGGNKQQGCGATFRWDEAEPYSAHLQSKRERGFKITPEEASKGKGLFHHGIDCGICKQTILGPRLRCIHCENFEVCIDCEDQLDSHDLSHVFEIFYKSEFDWSDVHLPRGVPVRIVRNGCILPPRWFGNQFEGKVGSVIELVKEAPPISKKEYENDKKPTYKVSIHGHKGSDPQLPAENLVPLFRTREEAKSLLEGRWRAWVPAASSSFKTEIYQHLLATEGAIVACRYVKNPASFSASSSPSNLGGWRG